MEKVMKKLMSDKKDDKWDMKRLLLELATGMHKESPFDSELVDEIRVDLRLVCKQSGHGPGLPEEGDVVQAFEVRLIQGMMRVFGDPDEHMCHWWARGAWLGSPQRRLPRTPAVFDRKTRWAKIEPVDELHQGWQLNYPSLDEHANLVESQFIQEEREGLMLRTTVGVALAKYGDALNIASTGAIAKKGKTDEVRVIYDGSHGLDLNPGIRVRDQVRFPTAADCKVALSAMADEGGPHFALYIDFSKAHRRFPVEEAEWGRQACQVKGSAANEAQKALKKLAEKNRALVESRGLGHLVKPKFKPTAEDLSPEVLAEPL